MKSALRVFVFTLISLNITQKIFSSFTFSGNETFTFILVVIALTLLNLFVGPVLKLIALPIHGIANMILGYLLTLAILFTLTLFIPSFAFQSAEVGDLLIFGVVLPSRRLPAIWAFIVSTLVFTLLYRFFMWLTTKKKA